jgi:hypothetical protein
LLLFLLGGVIKEIIVAVLERKERLDKKKNK